MSDMDLFMKQQRQDDRVAPRRKQDRFEFRVLSKLLRALEPQPGWARSTMFQVGDDLSFRWFNNAYEQCPLKLSTYKLKDTLGLIEIIKRYQKTALCSEFDELQSNYPNNPVGLVFDSVGSGLSELIVHNWYPSSPVELLGWKLHIAQEDWSPIEIAPYKGFLTLLGANFQLEES